MKATCACLLGFVVLLGCGGDSKTKDDTTPTGAPIPKAERGKEELPIGKWETADWLPGLDDPVTKAGPPVFEFLGGRAHRSYKAILGFEKDGTLALYLPHLSSKFELRGGNFKLRGDRSIDGVWQKTSYQADIESITAEKLVLVRPGMTGGDSLVMVRVK